MLSIAAPFQAVNLLPDPCKKLGINIESSKNEAGDRVYQIRK